MFSPDATLNGASNGSLRNPRRRRRDDTERQREIPRKRSKIAADNFQPVATSNVNGDGQINGHPDGRHGNGLFARDFAIPVRDRRQASSQWRPSKTDESNVLVRRLHSPNNLSVIPDKTQSKTLNYTVKHVSALPDIVGSNREGKFQLNCSLILN